MWGGVNFLDWQTWSKTLHYLLRASLHLLDSVVLNVLSWTSCHSFSNIVHLIRSLNSWYVAPKFLSWELGWWVPEFALRGTVKVLFRFLANDFFSVQSTSNSLIAGEILQFCLEQKGNRQWKRSRTSSLVHRVSKTLGVFPDGWSIRKFCSTLVL